MNVIPKLLHKAYQVALIASCDYPRSNKALEKLVRVREIQLRAAKHYGVSVLQGPR